MSLFVEKHWCPRWGALCFLIWIGGCGQGLYEFDPYAWPPLDSGIDATNDDRDLDLGNGTAADLSCNESNVSVTKTFRLERGELSLCGVRLVLPGFNFETDTNVTLTQISKDGFLRNTQAMGPIFSITKTTKDGQRAKWNKPARVELTFKPFDSTIALDRLQVAYWGPLSYIWIAIPNSLYDPQTGVISAEVVELEVESFEFSVFVKCDDLSVCPPNQACRSQICQ